MDYHHHKSLVKALSASFRLLVVRGHKVLMKDWDVPRIIFVDLKRIYSACERLGCASDHICGVKKDIQCLEKTGMRLSMIYISLERSKL